MVLPVAVACEVVVQTAELPRSLVDAAPDTIRDVVEHLLQLHKIVATHYQHVDGTSFAAPIVSSIVAQMLEANPRLTPAVVKSILISTAERIAHFPAIKQGYGAVNAALELARREEHDLSDAVFGPPRIENGRLVFHYHDDSARSVVLAGDFNNWDRTNRLCKGENGLWRTEVDLPRPGSYQYKFLVDNERWLEDPSNGQKVTDQYGGLNSLLVIE